jgi:hypothetical protein
MTHESFVYKWTNINTGKFYIGKHKGTPDDGYISSGKSFLDCYHAEPSMFKREIMFYGTDLECYEQEGLLIRQAIQKVGYENIYNLTHYSIVRNWKRTCLHCGRWCDPANEEWANAFALSHFQNCQSIKSKPKKKQTQKEWRETRQKLGLTKTRKSDINLDTSRLVILRKIRNYESTLKKLSNSKYRKYDTDMRQKIEILEEKIQNLKKKLPNTMHSNAANTVKSFDLEAFLSSGG